MSGALPLSGLGRSNCLGADPNPAWSITTNATSLAAEILAPLIGQFVDSSRLCHETVDQSVKAAAMRQTLQLYLKNREEGDPSSANRPLRTGATPLTRGWQLEASIIRLVLEGRLCAKAPSTDPVAKWEMWRQGLGGKVIALRPFPTEELLDGTKQAISRAEEWRVGRVHISPFSSRTDSTVRLTMLDTVLVASWEQSVEAAFNPDSVLLANFDVRVLPSSFMSVIESAIAATAAVRTAAAAAMEAERARAETEAKVEAKARAQADTSSSSAGAGGDVRGEDAMEMDGAAAEGGAAAAAPAAAARPPSRQ